MMRSGHLRGANGWAAEMDDSMRTRVGLSIGLGLSLSEIVIGWTGDFGDRQCGNRIVGL
jgi:hypothetical protein